MNGNEKKKLRPYVWYFVKKTQNVLDGIFKITGGIFFTVRVCPNTDPAHPAVLPLAHYVW